MSKHSDRFKENSSADRDFCRNHAKQKNGMDYISWALMWACAAAKYDSVEYADGVEPAGVGLQVRVDVRTRIDDEASASTCAVLAVTDFKNKTIAEPTSADIQNTRQRALAKALSMHTGIGLSLWFGGI